MTVRSELSELRHGVRLLPSVFRELVRLFGREPLGMVGVVFARIFGGQQEAQERFRKIEGRK